jgi:hypothetical protein
MMNWKGFGRKWLCPNQGTIPAFVWRNWGKQRIIWFRKAGVSAKRLPITSLHRYLDSNLFGSDLLTTSLNKLQTERVGTEETIEYVARYRYWDLKQSVSPNCEIVGLSSIKSQDINCVNWWKKYRDFRDHLCPQDDDRNGPWNVSNI